HPVQVSASSPRRRPKRAKRPTGTAAAVSSSRPGRRARRTRLATIRFIASPVVLMVQACHGRAAARYAGRGALLAMRTSRLAATVRKMPRNEHTTPSRLDRLHDALGLRTSPRIFFPAALVAVVFVVGTILFTDQVDAAFAGASGWIMTNLGWLYIFGVTIFLHFLFYLAVSRFGRVRLGDTKPEHSGLAWFAMLFAAGIGSILMFWGVAEPINHYANPPLQDVEGETTAAA